MQAHAPTKRKLKSGDEPMLFLEKRQPMTKTNQLTSGQINQAQRILKPQYPEIGGLFCCTLGGSLEFPKANGEKWLQVVHSGKDHFRLVAFGFSDPVKVLVYESLNKKNWHNEHILSCMSSLFQTPKKEMTYIFKTVQRQNNTYDCGIFAIAFAISLLNGQDPTTIMYNSHMLRPDLQTCLEIGKLTLFPHSLKRSTRIVMDRQQTISVFCHCRRTAHSPSSENWTMIECANCLDWFHRMCEKYPGNTNLAWFCKNC